MKTTSIILDFQPKRIWSQIGYTSDELVSNTANVTDNSILMHLTDDTDTLTLNFGSNISDRKLSLKDANRVALDLPLVDHTSILDAIRFAMVGGKVEVRVLENGVGGATVTIQDGAGVTI